MAIQKSELRKAIDEILEEHEVNDGALTEDLIEKFSSEFSDDIYDDEDEEEE
jgi:hypothetical protein